MCQYVFLINSIFCLFLHLLTLSCCAFSLLGLGMPKGISFSDVMDTSATVHWKIPRNQVDSYRVTYVPIQGGK